MKALNSSNSYSHDLYFSASLIWISVCLVHTKIKFCNVHHPNLLEKIQLSSEILHHFSLTNLSRYTLFDLLNFDITLNECFNMLCIHTLLLPFMLLFAQIFKIHINFKCGMFSGWMSRTSNVSIKLQKVSWPLWWWPRGYQEG